MEMTAIEKENTSSSIETLKELIAGIILFNIAAQLVGVFLPVALLPYSIGLWVGAATAAAMAIHMHHSLSEALSYTEADAIVAVRKGAMIRYAIACVVMLVVYFTGYANGLAYVCGVLSLKAGAYLQPLLHGVSLKIRK